MFVHVDININIGIRTNIANVVDFDLDFGFDIPTLTWP